MVDQSHSFYLTSSLQQKLSKLVLAAFCLFTLYFWPQRFELWLIQVVIAIAICSYFSYAIYRLKSYKCSFSLHSRNLFKFANNPNEFECKVLWVSPLLCAFYILPNTEVEDQTGKSQFIIVWRDMLSDSNFRHLSRLLLYIRRNQASG
ncbi:hypothetical protein SOPP22_16530 [Shewanella sp. OPT22]|nr:hypothetical protein SOPP22_16530 [Shewanella sp. OPT22]